MSDKPSSHAGRAPGGAFRFEATRRVVTGLDAEGRSTVLASGPPPTILADPATGEGAAELWITPSVPEQYGPHSARDDAPFRLAPAAGGVRWRLFTVAPGETRSDEFQAVRAAVREAYESIGGADALVDSPRHPAMHRTSTLDIVVVIAGELTLVLDTEDVVLKPGDSVVQNGVAHAWANRGDALALAFVALIDADGAPAQAR